MKKMVIDCSIPLEDREIVVVDMKQEEIAIIEEKWAEQSLKDSNKPKSVDERLSELEQEIQTLKGK